jgi:hypothetical protein
MKLSHFYIYGDNINSLCDFYSFVFDCDIDLSESDPCLKFDNHKFIFKKVLGKRENILPSFALEMDSQEFSALKQRLSLFAYKSHDKNQFIREESDYIEVLDPAGNIFILNQNTQLLPHVSKL